jgi:hypothetical protein
MGICPCLWSGHSRASGPCSQVPKLCIYGGSGEIFSSQFANKISRETVTRRAAEPKQKSELPQGACQAPSGARTKAGRIPGENTCTRANVPPLVGEELNCASGSNVGAKRSLNTATLWPRNLAGTAPVWAEEATEKTDASKRVGHDKTHARAWKIAGSFCALKREPEKQFPWAHHNPDRRLLSNNFSA